MVAKKKLVRKKVAKKKVTKKKSGGQQQIKDVDIRKAIDLTASGKSLKDACNIVGIGYEGVRHRIRKEEELRTLDAHARQEYLNVSVRKMNDLVEDEEDVQKARLKCDNIKWEASRVLRKIYGDKSELDVSVGVKPMSKAEMTEWMEKFGATAI